MAKKAKISKEARRRVAEAGKKNLMMWHEKTGSARQEALTHGAYSSTIRHDNLKKVYAK